MEALKKKWRKIDTSWITQCQSPPGWHYIFSTDSQPKPLFATVNLGGGGVRCRSEKNSTPHLLHLSWGGGKFSGVKSAAFLDNLGDGFNLFLSSPLFREMIPIWRAYFSDGLVQPPTSNVLNNFLLTHPKLGSKPKTRLQMQTHMLTFNREKTPAKHVCAIEKTLICTHPTLL